MLEWLNSTWTRWKVQVSFVGGALVELVYTSHKMYRTQEKSLVRLLRQREKILPWRYRSRPYPPKQTPVPAMRVPLLPLSSKQKPLADRLNVCRF